MTRGKNYNSIVFLTTLSVYLGLVLVGATPQVLAQAALTRNFDIQIEAEVKDDLDNKPENDDLSKDVEAVRNFNIAQAIISFADDLKKLKSIGKVNYETDLNFSQSLRTKLTFNGGYSVSKISSASNPWLETALEELLSNAEAGDLISISDFLSDCEEKNCRETSIEIHSNNDEFTLTFGFTKSSAEKAGLAAEKFGSVFVSKKAASRDAVIQKIYENTKVSSENNQIFIVTRLPRGSIDSLLAKNAN